MREMVVKQLASTSGLQRWVDYIPMKLATSTRPAGEQTTDADGFIAINSLQDTSSGVAFKDWVPVYFDSDATDAWVVSDSGYIPVGASGGAIAILQSFGSDAHVYLPGSSGVSLSGLLTNNHTNSTGSTGYSANDGVAGLALDAAGSVVPMSAPSTGGTAGWGTYLSTVASNGTDLTISNTGAAEGYGYFQHGSIIAGLTYRIQFTIVSRSVAVSGTVQVGQTTVTSPASGLFQATVKATNTHGIWIGVGTGAGASVVIRDVTLSEVTGIHATQATTANKPAVRRGVYNELLNSATPATQNVTCIAAPYTLALYGTGSVTLSGTGSGTLNGTGASDLVVLNFTPTAGTVTFTKSGTVSSFGLFKGTLTAAQIIAEGGIPLTTSVAASNPNAGRYWWSFDGSNDYLQLGSVPVSLADDFVFVCAARVDSTANSGKLISLRGAGATPVIQLSLTAGRPFAQIRDDTGASATRTHGADITAMSVSTLWKVGTNVYLRVNGVQSGAALSASGFGATTLLYAAIGAAVIGGTPEGLFQGAIGLSGIVKGTMTESDVLTIERLAAASVPNGPSF